MQRVRAWVNGQLLDDPTAPAVAVSDHGLTVGDGVFEAIKVVDGRPFALGRHLERLVRSAEGLGLPAPDQEEVRRGVAAVLDGERRGRWAGSGSPTRPGRRRWAPAGATASRR